LYSLGADLVITEDQVRTPETLAKIASLGRPSRLGFNAVGGKSATNLARLLGENAHLVTYGGMSREPVTLPTSLFIFKNLTSTGFWLNKWFLQRPVQERIDIYSDLFHLIRNGLLKEPIHETLSMTQSTDSELEQIGTWSNERSKSKRILIP
jgi:mitochondrial enoyl-[acyl-carrier protein] reductase / trans-2-enoyl-CoA reductase